MTFAQAGDFTVPTGNTLPCAIVYISAARPVATLMRRCHSLGRKLARDGVADILEAGKIPEVGEVAALLRLDRLDGAILPDEEFAFAVRFFKQGQPFAIVPQARVLFDKFLFRLSEMDGDA